MYLLKTQTAVAKPEVATMEPSKGSANSENAFWRPFSLEFESQRMETAYYESVLPARMLMDAVAQTVGVFFVPAFLRALVSFGAPLAVLILTALIALLCPPAVLFLYVYKRELLARYREPWVFFLRSVVVAGFTAATFAVDTPPRPRILAVLATYLTKTPIHFLCSAFVILRVEFRHHILFQTGQTIFALFWIPSFCVCCSTDPSLLKTFHQMGYGMDFLVSYPVLNREPDPTIYPCWMVSGFALVTVGFILPSLFVLLLELSGRVAFAQRRMADSPSEAESLLIYYRQAIRVAVFGSLSLILGSWFVLSRMRDALFPEYSVLHS